MTTEQAPTYEHIDDMLEWVKRNKVDKHLWLRGVSLFVLTALVFWCIYIYGEYLP